MSIVESIKELFVQWGASWVLWLLFALSVGSLAIALERWWVFRKKGDDLGRLAAILDAYVPDEQIDDALDVLARRPSVGARVLAAGLRLADRGTQAVQKAMESALKLERKALEARLVFLGTLGNNAPFIGLFGTVIGVVLAFDALGDANTATGTGAGQAASAEVMAAIAEALVATAVGIAVALPAVALYNYFQRRITNFMTEADALSDLLLAYLCADGASHVERPDDAPSSDEG